MCTKKEQVWIEEYLQCWNATEAARRAAYKWPNKTGPAKLEKFRDVIRARIDEKVMDADEVLLRLSEIARGEWRGYLTPTGGTDFASLIEDGKAHLVKSIKETANAGKTVEFCDMQAALVQLGKVHGLFRDVHEHTGKDGGPIQTEGTVKVDLTRYTDEDIGALATIAGRITGA